MFLYFRSDICPWCLKLEREVLEKNFALISLDVYGSENHQLLGKYRVAGTPTLVFLNSKGEETWGTIGFLDGGKFLEVVNNMREKMGK